MKKLALSTLSVALLACLPGCGAKQEKQKKEVVVAATDMSKEVTAADVATIKRIATEVSETQPAQDADVTII